MWYLYTVESYSAIKKNEILPLTTTWMNLGGIMLSGISQRKTNTMYNLYMESKKIKQTSEYNKTETDS